MAHPSTLRSRTQPRPQQFRQPPQPSEQNWEDDPQDNFDVELHLASHAQRLKNVDSSLNYFEQSLKNFQDVYIQERNRQNKLLGILAGGVVLTALITAFWPHSSPPLASSNAPPQTIQTQQQRIVQQQLAAPPVAQLQPAQMPVAQQTYSPNFSTVPPVQAPSQQMPVLRPVTPLASPASALGARYEQQQQRITQSYLAAPAQTPLAQTYVRPAPQPRLSPFQLSVQNKLAARGEAIPSDWQPLFDREARGDKKGKLLIAAKFLKGDSVTRDQAFAVEMIRQSADAGEKEAMLWLAYANQGGNIGKTDVNAAIRWFQAAGKAGVAQAYTELGRIYETGADGAPDLETALAWYQRGAQAGDMKSAEAIHRLTTGLAAQQPAQPVMQPSYAPQTPAGTPAQQIQQMMQNGAAQTDVPMLAQANPNPANPTDLFVPAQTNVPVIDVAPAYSATPVVAAVPTSAPSSQLGMSREQANAENKSIQRMLRALGYKIDRVDGDYGPQTAAAIRAYQRDHSVYPDGEPTPELVNALLRDSQGL